MKSRDDAKQQSRRSRERHREQDHGGIDSDVGQAGNALWLETEQPVEAPYGEKEAERAAEKSENHTLGEQLPHQPYASGSQCASNGHLTLAGGRPGEQEVGNVRT